MFYMFISLNHNFSSLNNNIAVENHCYVEVGKEHDAKVLSKKLFAVHVTRMFPQDGILKASLAGKESILGGMPVELFPDFRCTVHFSLGEMVRPVDGVISWEDYPFAVVSPLSELLPQLINLNCYDTFILGDYYLNQATTLVVPISYQGMHTLPCDVYYYNPLTTTLRQAVDEAIDKQDGWHIRMSSEDNEEHVAPAWLDDINVNTPSFFAPLREKYPHLSIGCRFTAIDGEAYRFGKIELLLYALAKHYLPLEQENSSSPIATEEVQSCKEKLLKEAKAIASYANTLPFSQQALDVFNTDYARLLSWINILTADLHLRTAFQKTIMQAPPEYWVQINRYRSSPEELLLFLEANLSNLPTL
jgi:hypothetical protein